MFEGDAILDTAEHWERVIAHAQAQQLKAFAELAELRRHPDGHYDKHTPDELALGPAAQVNVTVPASSLLGLTREPGELAGYGPIPADVAREIAGDATWRRLLTDPASGALLDYGRTRYQPPTALAEFVRARDMTCTFPGFRRAADRCELDHEIPYPQGPTSAANLDPKCRHHHQTRHHPNWQYERLANGDHHWVTPAGRHYIVHPKVIATPIPAPTIKQHRRTRSAAILTNAAIGGTARGKQRGRWAV